MHRSVKYLLQPTAGHALSLDHLLLQQCHLYNAALEERKTTWEIEKRSVTRYDQFAGLNGIKDSNPAIGRYGAVVARGTLIRLDLAYRAFYRRCKTGKTPGHPRFKGQYRWDSVSYPGLSGWKLTSANRLYLQGVGHVKTKIHRPLPGRAKTCIVKREGKRWWVVIQYDQVEVKPLASTGDIVGIDLGTRVLYATSDAELATNPRFTRRAADRLATGQRELARMTKGSNHRRKQVQKVAAQYRKVANCRRNYAHQQSRRLINEYDFLAHEKLDIPKMTKSAKGTVEHPGTNVKKKRNLNRSIQDAGWGQLIQFITYKAEEAGREIEAVNPAFTSQMCYECGHVDEENRHNEKFRCLSCGHEAHADVNAAKNILRAGLAQREARELVQRESVKQMTCNT